MADNLGPICYRYLNNSFLVFKQHYMYFHTLFHSQVFLKNTNNITRNLLPKEKWETLMI